MSTPVWDHESRAFWWDGARFPVKYIDWLGDLEESIWVAEIPMENGAVMALYCMVEPRDGGEMDVPWVCLHVERIGGIPSTQEQREALNETDVRVYGSPPKIHVVPGVAGETAEERLTYTLTTDFWRCDVESAYELRALLAWASRLEVVA